MDLYRFAVGNNIPAMLPLTQLLITGWLTTILHHCMRTNIQQEKKKHFLKKRCDIRIKILERKDYVTNVFRLRLRKANRSGGFKVQGLVWQLTNCALG